MTEYLEEEEREEAQSSRRWLITWADMMSVLLTFFIVLQAFSTISEKKFSEAVSSIQRAFTVPLPIRSPGTADFQPRQTMAEEIHEQIEREHLDGVEVRDFGDHLVLTVESGVLFELGRAEITPEGHRVMNGVARALSGVKGNVRVEGHTCDLPLGWGSAFRNNWWLSAARALTVLEALQARGFPPQRISATGYGEYRPVQPNDSEPHRAANRRVEFVVEKDSRGAD